MKKHTLILIGVILLSGILQFISPSGFIWGVKLDFLSKIGLVVGIIGLWLFSVLPNMGTSNKNIESK